MHSFKRSEFKTDPKVLGKLHAKLVKIHKVASHTQKVLFENKHIKDFCEEARHFVILKGDSPLYIHYDVTSRLDATNSISCRIDAIAVYDSFMEFENAKNRGLHSGKPSDIPNIN
jgi:hypothetical protein